MTNINKKNLMIGIVGLGAVGSAVKHALDYYHSCVGYDIDGRGTFSELLTTKMLFICVSTPGTGSGILDCSAVSNVLKQLSEAEYSGICVIKSTVNVGFTDEAEASFPNLQIVYMPEFLREKSNFTWVVNPDRLVLSGTKYAIDHVLEAFEWVDGLGDTVPILCMSHKEAEIGKLAHNARIAVLVSFTNEIELISHEYGADPNHVMSVIHADRRVKSTAHLIPGLGPYGGKCVPKDTRALISSSHHHTLLSAAEMVNNSFKEVD
ncbi:MAG: hypothetical protein M0P20_06965 [Methanocorpusculum sp.]|nr:hypothetical protein [Methanocorpusculum sp.]